ncbi:MAG: hypothetical protein HOY69_36620, partial [Streptomyces sp.]|nr:hypothetical protein [Streptomyces sp.]
MKPQVGQYRQRRYEVRGADGVRLVAWDYAAAAGIAGRAAGRAPVPAAR